MKILLYTPTPPNEKYSGGLMTQQMCQILLQNHHQIFCASVNTRRASIPISKKFKQIQSINIIRPNDLIIPDKWPLSGIANHLINFFQGLHTNFCLKPKVISFGREHQIDCVWAIIQGKSIIVSAQNIAQALGVPLISQVWDDPSWSLMNAGLNHTDQKTVLRRFDDLIRSSQTCATASWEMSRQYLKKYGVKTVAIVASLDPKIAQPAVQTFHQKELNIALAGQLYAKEEWQALTEALSDQKWVIKGRKVKIHLIGKFRQQDFPREFPIVIHPYTNQKNLIKILSDMDICYCPYWFDRKFESVAKTSFPSKLTSYLAAGRPVLFHGPKYASPAKFIEVRGGGLCCFSLRKQDIIKTIEKIIASSSNYASITKQGRKAFLNFLSLDQFQINVKKIFDLTK